MLASASSLWYKMCTYDILTNMAAHTDEYKKNFAHCKHVLSFGLAFLFKSKHYKTGENTGKSFTFYLRGLQIPHMKNFYI